MYLMAVLRTYKSYGDEKEDERRTKIKKTFPAIFKSGNLDSIEVSFEAGYWRKANQIHKWFVENVQEGKDDCGEYYVSREQLLALLEIVNELIKKLGLKKGKMINGYSFKDGKKTPILEDGNIISNPEIAKEMLPSEGGFFFGGTDYDEYCFNDLVSTKEMLEKCLTLPEEWGFIYHSSW